MILSYVYVLPTAFSFRRDEDSADSWMISDLVDKPLFPFILLVTVEPFECFLRPFHSFRFPNQAVMAFVCPGGIEEDAKRIAIEVATTIEDTKRED